MTEVNQEVVLQFLNDNPDFLENYVLSHVNKERLQRWMAWKEQARKKRHGDPNVNGEISLDRKTSMSKWKASAHSKKWILLQELTRNIHHHSNKIQVLTELARCVATATAAEGYNIYLLDEHTKELHYQRLENSNLGISSSCIGKAQLNSSLASFVALTGETVRIGDILSDDRFPEGLAVGGDKAQSVMGLPIIKADGKISGVLELYRNVGGGVFTVEDEEVTTSMLMWADICVEYVEMHSCMTKQRKLNDFLLTVAKSIFQDIVSMDTVIMKIMNYAKKLVNADRASLFLLDSKTNELYARIFDTGPFDENMPRKEIRFPMDKGVAGHVASTGEVLNIPDAYMDKRFNREVDMQTGYRTKSILCMPIYIRGNTIGVVQMVNKLNGTFTKADEESFETFAVYCGLALHHAKLYDKIRRSEQKYRVALDVLSYHSQCSDEEFLAIKQTQVPEYIENITNYSFSPWTVIDEDKIRYVLYMFRELFTNATRFEQDDLIRFTLTVRKNYRNVPYHNWDHAFSVAHAVYTVIKTAKHNFTPFECLALFVACLCHDLDHRGKTNAFMVKSASPLAAIYSTSTMEHHHFNQTVTILQNEGHNIFKHLSSEEYKKMLSGIRQCILATDLALFFGNRAKLKEILDKGDFTWDSEEHRHYLEAIVMTSADLCANAKPWDIQLETVQYIMAEFYQQGDEEKQRGMTPMPMMDREKKHELPQLEVGFLVGICLPCYELMAQVLPDTKPMADGASANLKRWQELADREQEEVEKALSSYKPDINDDKHRNGKVTRTLSSTKSYTEEMDRNPSEYQSKEKVGDMSSDTRQMQTSRDDQNETFSNQKVDDCDKSVAQAGADKSTEESNPQRDTANEAEQELEAVR
ncbi:hypothetical protein CHS0354_042228 [Potamilus streckersoni]|uniref:Phosphodiesterase n=1 Tax=Potamilus streckersoni TaxID=2493646 RepID=A0AAE0TMC4_9BIVA|nr:hypothetical protein CHS0354_042228 [Potamilus streckersoni]